MLRKALQTCVLFSLAAVPVGLVRGGSDDAAPAGRGLQGVWEIQVLPIGAPPLQDYLTVGADGMVVTSEPYLGTGVGASRRVGPKTYEVNFHGFLDATTGERFEVQSTVELEGRDSFSGPFLTTILSPSGGFLYSFGGSVTGTRLPVQGL